MRKKSSNYIQNKPMITHENYGFIRVAVASPELQIANVKFNIEKIIQCSKIAVESNCHLILFPELSLTGYTCADLFYQKTIYGTIANNINQLKNFTLLNECTLIVGAPVQSNGKLFNCAIVISNGFVKAIIPKTYLCNTNEYYEERWFSSEFDRVDDWVLFDDEQIPFGADILFKVNHLDCFIGIEICEDLWATIPPSSNKTLAGANILMNLSASSEYLAKNQYRKQLVLNQSARCLAAYVYSSSGPGESSTDLVFSGHCLIAENGILLNETERFKFDNQIIIADIDIEKLNNERIKNNTFSYSKPDKEFRVLELELPATNSEKILRTYSPTPFIPADEKLEGEVCQELFSLQTTGLMKRLKHINCSNVVLGVSGGLDSTLALLVAFKSFQKLNLPINQIHSISMPGFGTTSRTKNNAELISNLLKVNYLSIPINKSVLQHFKDIGHNPDKNDIVYENAQARERTQILMDYANKVNGIVIGTGDLSELALGWCTYNGDHISMYNVNSGVPKTLVKYIIKWVAKNEFSEEIAKVLYDIIDTPISPELLPAGKDGEIQQKTEDHIGPYMLHDFFLYYFVRHQFAPNKILKIAEIAFEGKYSKKEILKWLKVFYNRFFSNQYKRSCVPDGIKVGSVSLSPRGDWRMPSDASVRLWLDDLQE